MAKKPYTSFQVNYGSKKTGVTKHFVLLDDVTSLNVYF